MLEVLELDVSAIPALLKIIEPSKVNVLIDPLDKKEGQYKARWHVRVNITIDEIKAGIWE